MVGLLFQHRKRKDELFGGNFPPKDWFIYNRVIIGTYQTLIRRIDKYATTRFDLFCIDEAQVGMPVISVYCSRITEG